MQNKSLLISAVILPIILLRCSPTFADNFEQFKRKIDINQFFNELQGQVGYQGTDVPGQGNSIDDLESQGMKQKESNEIFSQENALKRQQKLDETGFNRNNKGFLDKALHTVKNSDKEFDYLKSSTQVCSPTEETVTDSSIETCDQFYQLEEQTCFPKQVVEIDPKYHYQCSKKCEVKEKICSDVIKNIKCTGSSECDVGGIERGSVASDMRFDQKDGVLTIGTIADNYWGGNCQLYDKNTTFKLKNVHLIKDFTIFNVGFDDYMEIIVNGTSVYAGPDGGRNLQIVQRTIKTHFFHRTENKVNNGHSDYTCERNTNWNINNLNIDLKPYLKEGENSIRISVIVSGHGEGWLKIRAKQNCCSKWDIQREVKCE